MQDNGNLVSTIDYAPFSQKHIEVLKSILDPSVVYVNLEGGKRGRKNVVSLAGWALFLEQSKDILHLAIGFTVASAKTNIIDCNGFGLRHIFQGRCRQGKYEENEALYIRMPEGQPEKIVIVCGGGKVDSANRFKGYSIGSVYYDQAELLHENTITEALDRTNAAVDPKHIYTSNPKAPQYFLYVRFFNRWEKLKEYRAHHFTMWDNPAINKERRKMIIRRYDPNGVYFKRDILGLRVAAEGRCYPSASKAKIIKLTELVSPQKPLLYNAISIGIDNGYTDGTAMVAIGFKGNWKKIDVFGKFYHENKKQETLTSDEYVTYLVAFVEKIILWFKEHNLRIPEIYVCNDSADKDFRMKAKRAMVRHGYNTVVVMGAEKGLIVDRVMMVETLLFQDRIAFLPDAREVRDALEQAVWDPEEKLKGNEVRLDPSAAYSHINDATEYAIYKFHDRLQYIFTNNGGETYEGKN